MAKKKKKAKKAASKAKPVKNVKAVKARYNKSQLLNALSEKTGVARKEVGSIMEALGDVIHSHVKKGAAGEFLLPGLLKIKTVKKPATKARKGTNPFTGEEMMFKAKPATTKVKVLPLKNLKEMALK